MGNKEHSRAYQYLVDQIDAKGSQKLSGYYPRIMEEIYDWERKEVEDIIWQTFNTKIDTDLAMFLPKLKRYKGIDALKRVLNTCIIPSGNSLNIAEVLYNHTEEKKYLEVIKQNIFASRHKENLSAVSTLLRCKPSDAVFTLLAEVYLATEDNVILGTAAKGLLYNKGYINDIHSLKEPENIIDLRRRFRLENKEERKAMLEKLINGDI